MVLRVRRVVFVKYFGRVILHEALVLWSVFCPDIEGAAGFLRLRRQNGESLSTAVVLAFRRRVQHGFLQHRTDLVDQPWYTAAATAAWTPLGQLGGVLLGSAWSILDVLELFEQRNEVSEDFQTGQRLLNILLYFLQVLDL